VGKLPSGNLDSRFPVTYHIAQWFVPVNGIRFASRATKGVTIFNTAEGEKVVSVERISEPQSDEEAEDMASNETDAGDTGGSE
ncbi:DNA gyrase C-terminal beta-propeller domain-containing protein, partial [Mesorhizobium sp. B2-7-1]|uniref:DNA gyrase C-terminal beta-propeller domain-containing protein n=1 Tax=Mesorhizobium sp. B2-7-1 TaxID=2589909 RepID=UPI001FEF20CE